MEVVLSLGSNYGDRAGSLKAAIDWVSGILSNCLISSIYETDAIGGGSPYMNAVVKGEWQGSAEELNIKCKEYERTNGRTPEARMLKRVPIDIDVVVAAGTVLRERDFRCAYFKRGINELV